MPFEWAQQESEQDKWIRLGQQRGWLREFCVTHEWLQLMTRAERDEWVQTADTCAIRLVVENPDNPALGHS